MPRSSATRWRRRPRAWQAFDGHAFAEQVIRRRTSFLGLTTSELDQEPLQCLQLPIELGQVSPPYNEAKSRVDELRQGHRLEFRQEHGLRLTNIVKTEVSWSVGDTQGWFGRVTRRTSRRTVERETRTERRLSAGVIRRIAGLRSLEHLSLRTLDPEAVSALAELTSLKSLAFIVERPADLQWLPRLIRLTSLSVGGSGVRDLSPLAGLTRLTRLALSRSRRDDEVAKLQARLPGLDIELITPTGRR